MPPITASARQAANARHPLANEIRKQIPAQEREGGEEHEACVDRTAEQADARQTFIEQRESRRVAAEHVKKRENQDAGHQQAAAPEQTAARDAEPGEQQHRHRADEQVIERLIGELDFRHPPARPPVIDLMRTEHIGGKQRREIGRMQRALQRASPATRPAGSTGP